MCESITDNNHSFVNSRTLNPTQMRKICDYIEGKKQISLLGSTIPPPSPTITISNGFIPPRTSDQCWIHNCSLHNKLY